MLDLPLDYAAVVETYRQVIEVVIEGYIGSLCTLGRARDVSSFCFASFLELHRQLEVFIGRLLFDLLLVLLLLDQQLLQPQLIDQGVHRPPLLQQRFKMPFQLLMILHRLYTLQDFGHKGLINLFIALNPVNFSIMHLSILILDVSYIHNFRFELMNTVIYLLQKVAQLFLDEVNQFENCSVRVIVRYELECCV